MKLYSDPGATTCRPILLLAHEDDLDLEVERVDLMTGEHMSERFAAINPNRLVPVLEDGDFRLTECSAILKYLADASSSTFYPREPKARARVHEAMDWFMINLYRDLGYGVVYPQTMPHYRRPNPVVQTSVIQWGHDKSAHWLGILDASILGDGRTSVCGSGLTIADFLGASVVTLGELVDFDLSPWPNVVRWIDAMKARPSWAEANAAFYAMRDMIQAQQRQTG